MRAWFIAFVLLAVGCGGGRSQVEVLEATTSSDGNVLGLIVGSCNASPTVEVVETAEEVRIEVEADDPGMNRDDCLDSVAACLDQPLGERALVDDKSGDVVSVEVRNDAALPPCPVP